MIVLAFQSLFNVPCPPAVTQTPVQGTDRLVLPSPLKQPRFSSAAMVATGLCLVLSPAAVIAPWYDLGGQVQSVQPPHPRPERSGSQVGGDQGIQLPLVAALQTSAYPFGYDEPFVYPRKNFAVAAALIPGEDGTDGRFVDWKNDGWQVLSVQPPHLRPERNAAILRGIDGIDGQYQAWRNAGWEIQCVQPPRLRYERFAAAAPSIVVDARLDAWRNAGWEIQPPQPPHRQFERAGAIAPIVTVEARYVDWRNDGWPVQAVQPPHPRPERAAAIARGDEGNQAPLISALQTDAYPFGYDEPFVFPRRNYALAGSIMAGRDGIESPYLLWVNDGWEVQAVQPPQIRSERFAAVAPSVVVEAVFARWLNTGWEVQHPQPPHPRAERSGAIAPVVTIEARYVDWRNAGQDAQAVQPPHPRPERGASILRGDDGTQAVMVSALQTSAYPFGYDEPYVSPRRNYALAGAIARGIDGTDAGYVDWRYLGFEVQASQPPRLRLERGGAFLKGDDGNLTPTSLQTASYAFGYDEPFVFPRRVYAGAAIFRADDIPARFESWRNAGWDVQAVQPGHPRVETRGGGILRGDDGAQGTFTFWRNSGWEVQPVQPPHLRTEAKGAIAPSVVIDAVYSNWRNDGWEAQTPSLRLCLGRAAAIQPWLNIEATYANWRNAGWETQAPQPPHPRSERAGAVAPLVTVEAIYSNWRNAGWELQPQTPPHPRPEKAGAIAPWAPVEARFESWQNAGWEVQAPQPPHRGVETKTAAIARGDDGNEATLVLWRNAGWEVQPPQPPHPRPERSGVQVIGDGGIESPMIPGLPTAAYPFGIDGPFVFPRKPFERWAAIAPRSDGTDATYVVWRNDGWQVRPDQPPHRRQETKAAAFMRGDDGTQARYVLWTNVGFEVQPVQPPHRAPEVKYAAQVGGDLGAYAQFVQWRNAGWETQPVQPRGRQNRAGAMAALVNVDGRFVDWRNGGWEIQPPQPPHPRPERAGALAAPVSIEAVFNRWQNAGWEPHLQLLSNRRITRGAILGGRFGVDISGTAAPLTSAVAFGYDEPYVFPRKAHRSAAIAPRDDGIAYPFHRWLNSGWEAPPLQPPHPRHVFDPRGDSAVFVRFFFPVNVVVAESDVRPYTACTSIGSWFASSEVATAEVASAKSIVKAPRAESQVTAPTAKSRIV